MACCAPRCTCVGETGPAGPAGPPGSMFASVTVTTDTTANAFFRVVFEAGTLPLAAPGPPRTFTLPAVPVLDEEYIVKDATGTASALRPIVISGNVFLIDGTATKTIATAFGAMHFKFDGTQWRVI